MRARRVHLALLVLAVGAGGTLTATVVAQDAPSPGASSVEATMRVPDGRVVGTVRLAETRFGTLDVQARLTGLPAGFHGFHVHAVGRCEGPAFASAMGHFKAEGEDHGAHKGDFSSLLVKQNGAALVRLTTDRLKLADLRDADGSAIMVHADEDNFGNVAPRYAPSGPDQQTRDTGDAGGRIACGVVAAGS